MKLERIHSYLVHPAKREEEQPVVRGTTVPTTGSLGVMLGNIFKRAPEECDIEIMFQPDAPGNPCRGLLVDYIGSPTIAKGQKVAERLQGVTTHRSGLGLLFLMRGSTEHGRLRLVISRFPADQGVIAEERADRLSVEFVERVFMRSTQAYKSAVYEDQSIQRGFLEGRAIDRQISGPREISAYWIEEFLASALRTTSAQGTKRFAVALRNAARTAESVEVRQELVAAATLAAGRSGKAVTVENLMNQLGMSREARTALERNLPHPDLVRETFQFDRAEFEKHVMYRAVELDTGGLLMAEHARFSEVFEVEIVDQASERVRYTTEGRVVDEKLRKTK